MLKKGNIIDRHSFVKWWDKFPQTYAIVQTVYKDFAKKSPLEKSISLAIPLITITGLVTPSHFLPPPKEKKVANDKIPDDKSAATASSSSSKKKKKKKGRSKIDMRMFQQFLKSYKEENPDENSEEESEDKFDSSSFSLNTDGICEYDCSLFGHDPACTQDIPDAIPGIEDIPELNY